MSELKYKVGDRVRIKSLDWYNKRAKETEVNWEYFPFSCYMKKYCGQIMTISIVRGCSYSMIEDDYRYAWTDEMIECKVEEETEPKYEDEKNGEAKPKYEDEVNGQYYSTTKYLVRPSGYQFVDENGNVINATKIVLEKKKKEYPKTYEECLSVLEIYNGLPDVEIYNAKPSECNLFESFIRLKRCRDAYWKIAGDEMGLGKPWKPSNYEMVYTIYRHSNKIGTEMFLGESVTFEFPTAEMRDFFKENFGPDLEFCKELL